jgi:hypothetical protein
MARITEALLKDQGFSRGAQHAMLDPSYGGQFGWAPKLTELVSNQAYVRRNLICILLEAPQFFQLMPEPEKWVQCLKSLVELHPRTIEGFNAGLTVDTDNHPVGGGGELQDEFIDVKRARSEPVFTFVEKYGMPIQNFLYNWITYGMMDPDTKYAMVGTLEANRPTDMLLDWYSMSCLFVEPDPTHQYVTKSWVTTNMFPKGTGEIVGKRDLTSQSEILTLNVEFTGVSQFNLGTNAFAQAILDNINITNANPHLRPAFIQGLSADVARAPTGYAAGAAELGATSLAGAGNP